MRSRSVSAAVTTIALGLLLTGSVLASNFGGPRDPAPKHCNTSWTNSQCVGENWYHNLDIQASVDAGLREEVVWVAANYTAVTDVTMVVAEAGDTNIDVRVRAANYGAIGWYAATSCQFPGLPTLYGGSETPLPGTRWCKAQLFDYNLYYRASKYPTDNNERSIACQELGHTLGLRHATSGTGDPDWANSCMKTNNLTKTTTTQHDRDHVNARY